MNEQPQFKIRLPETLRNRIKVAAVDNRRTMGAEIVARLEMSFASAGGGAGSALRIAMVGASSADIEDLKDEPVVVLTGTVEAIREAARMFGRDVVLTAAVKDGDTE